MVLTALKFVGLITLAAFALIGWVTAPIVGVMPLRAWFAAGFIGAIVIGAIGAELVRKWFWVPVVVATGFLLGTTWVEWRVVPHDMDLSLFDNFSSAMSIYGSPVIAPGAFASAVGVALVRLTLLWRATGTRQ